MHLTFWQTISIKIQDVHEANRHENLLKLRVSLSTFDPPIAKVIEVGLVPILVNRLETESIRNLKEITWILINVAFGTFEQSYSIIEAGGVPKFINLMKSADPKIATNSTWVLCNLCGEGTGNRDFIIRCGVVPVLAELLKKTTTNELQLLRTLVWLGLNITRFSRSNLLLVQELLQPMLNLLVLDDRKILVDICWFFSNLINLNRNIPKETVRNILIHLSPLFDGNNPFVIESALRCVTAVVHLKSISQNDEIHDAGLLPKIIALIFHESFIISRLATMCCRLIAIASARDIQQLMDHNIIEKLCQLFDGDHLNWQSKREGIWLMSNVVLRGSIQQVIDFMENPYLLKTVFNLLKTFNQELLKQLLAMLLQLAEEEPIPNTLLSRFREAELDINLVKLLDHIDDAVHASSYRLLELIFPEELLYTPQDLGDNEE